MKRVTKKVKTETVFFRATDGTEFNDKSECSKYERTARCAIGTLAKPLMRDLDYSFESLFYFLFGTDMVTYGSLVAFDIKTKDDLETLAKFLVYHSPKADTSLTEGLKDDYVGKTVIVGRRAFPVRDDYIVLGTKDEIVDRVSKLVDDALTTDDDKTDNDESVEAVD